MAEPTDRFALAADSSVEGKDSAAFAVAERVLVAVSVAAVSTDVPADFVDVAALAVIAAVATASASVAPAIAAAAVVAALAIPSASVALVVAFAAAAAFAVILAVFDIVGIFLAAPYAVVVPSAFAVVVVAVVVVVAGAVAAVAGVGAAVEVVAVAVVEPVDFAVERSSELDRFPDRLPASRAVRID